MKWYSIKKYNPIFYGNYFVRFIYEGNYIDFGKAIYDGKEWLDFEEDDHLFKGYITHFAIPEPIEIEE